MRGPSLAIRRVMASLVAPEHTASIVFDGNWDDGQVFHDYG